MAVKVPDQRTFTDDQVAAARITYGKWWAYYADPTDGFTRFLRDCVYTSDEEAKTDLGEEAKKKFPYDKSYVEHLIRYGILSERLLVIPKSRRMTATWIVAAYCVWFAMFKLKRNVLWQAQNGQKSADTLKNKMLFIIENLPSDRIAPFVEVGGSHKSIVPAGWDSRLVNMWTGKRDASGLIGITFIRRQERETGEEYYEEDSRIIGIAEGENQWRQYTVSLGVMDEFAFFTSPGDSIKGARPAVGLNGKLIIISSANPGYMKDMVEVPDKGDDRHIGMSAFATIPPHKGVSTWVSKQGFSIYRLHYTADPAKDNPEWTMWPGDMPGNPMAGRARQGYDTRQWNQEMEIDFSVHSGTPFYPEWNDTLHLKRLKPIPDHPLILLFDFGLTPATLITQIAPSGHMLVLDEVFSTDAGIVQHCEGLIALLNARYGWWNKVEKLTSEDDWLLGPGQERIRRITSYVDPAGIIRAQTDMRSPIDILRDLKLHPEPSIQDPVQRSESVRRALRKLARYKDVDLPALLVDPSCKVLVEAMRGGAKVGNTRFTKDKNIFSHVADALEYGTVKFFRPTGYDPIADYYSKESNSGGAYIPRRQRIR